MFFQADLKYFLHLYYLGSLGTYVYYIWFMSLFSWLLIWPTYIYVSIKILLSRATTPLIKFHGIILTIYYDPFPQIETALINSPHPTQGFSSWLNVHRMEGNNPRRDILVEFLKLTYKPIFKNILMDFQIT